MPTSSRPPSADDLVAAIRSHVEALMGSPERVAEACARLRASLAPGKDGDLLAHPHAAGATCQLAALVAHRAGPAAMSLFRFLEEVARASSTPGPLVIRLLAARDHELRDRAIHLAVELGGSGTLRADEDVIVALAEAFEADGDRPPGPAALSGAARFLGPDERIEALFLTGSSRAVRRLAARVLDIPGGPPPSRLERLVGPESAALLGPYLDFTRATHADLVDLTPVPGEVPPIVASLRAAEADLGQALLAEIVGRIGWAHCAWGLVHERYLGISVGGSYPVTLAPAEAERGESSGECRREWDRWLVIAHGGVAGGRAEGGDDAVVRRFRDYNVAHAEALGEILEIAPLTASRTRRIIALLDRITTDFAALFGEVAEEAARLGSYYGELRRRVLELIADQDAEAVLGHETTRLVQMFEDPAMLDDVRTLHGLKRYLHQRGLRCAFRLFRASRATNRTVDLLTVSSRRLQHVPGVIRYLDFEPPASAGTELPFPVAMAARAFGLQLLHGRTVMPTLQMLLYGNEVQVYGAFRNHPAFARLDFSPPLRGGMIDLEYYGVSQYEFAEHPDRSLQGIRRIFRGLEYDIEQEGTRLHARYDKERARDLADLIGKAEALFRLFPYLMDVDWTIGGLDYPETAKSEVAGAWAAFFASWGVLPAPAFLTSDRRHVLLAIESDPAGHREVAWDGRGDYADRYRAQGAMELMARLREERDAAASGRDAGPHEADRFAELVTRDGEALVRAVRTARVVAAVERQLRFITTGSVQGYPVQYARLPLRGGYLAVFVLRDARGLAALALTPGFELPALLRVLRRDNYVPPGFEVDATAPESEAPRIVEELRVPNPRILPHPAPGERLVPANAASPGRAAGFARFRRPDRIPDDVDGSVFMAPTLRPEDTPVLRRTAAFVSTGGGILSHVGLIALELARPALIVAGRWEEDAGGGIALACRRPEFREDQAMFAGLSVMRRHDLRECDDRIREGDLVVADADTGVLAVLGQDRDALALHQSLALFREAHAALRRAEDPRDLLAERGRLVRASHQLGKVLARLERPALARHAAWELLTAPEHGAGEHLATLFANPVAGGAALVAARERRAELEQRLRSLCEEARGVMPAASNAYELLYQRLAVSRVADALRDVRRALDADRAPPAGEDASFDLLTGGIDRLAETRLEEIRMTLAGDIEAAARAGEAWRIAHRALAIADIDRVLGGPAPVPASGLGAVEQQAALAGMRDRLVVNGADGGRELAGVAGIKAASLGEVARVLGAGRVPAWFAVTSHALETMLAMAPGGSAPGGTVASGAPGVGGGAGRATLAGAIDAVLADASLDPARKSAAIRRLFLDTPLPAALERELLGAWRAVAGPAGVAVRSSGFEEDAPGEAWAGQFDTFLHVRDTAALLDHVRLAWAGFWSERAIHRRAREARPGGGIIVQRMVPARVSGVLHTVSLAAGRLDEMVINAGLGLGEGVVSGTVDVDQVLVSKRGLTADSTLRFRYRVGDKREQVVYDERSGYGTRRVETRYHQRLRAALEYVELRELVAAALELEAAFGRPLDLEFAWEASSLSILQVRPIAVFDAVCRETVSRYPLHPGRRAAPQELPS